MSSPRCCSGTRRRSWTPPRRARRAEGVGGGAGSRARAGDRAGRAAGGGQQGGAGRAGHARDRQAVSRGAGRGPGDRRHVRLLPRRGTAAVRADRAVGDAEQAALHLPDAGRRGGDHHRGQLPGGGARVVPGAGDPVRQRGRVEAGGVQRRAGRRDGPAVPCRRRAGGCAERRAGVGCGHVRGLESALEDGLVDKVGFTGSAPSARRSASCAGATSSRRAWSSAARTRWS